VAHAPAWPGPVATAALAVTFVAEVLAQDGEGLYNLDAGAGRCSARRAASCLLEPAAGDQVACWCSAAPHDGAAAPQAFIVAVLVRAAPGSASTLALQGDTLIDARNGTLRLKAAHAIEVEAPQCTLRTQELDIGARAASLVVDSWHSIAARCAATVGQLRLVGQSLSTVFERQTAHAQSCRRQVDGLDQLEAHTVEHHARDVLHLHGQNLLVNGERLVKVRAAQVHLG
jgi:hypothetical protein